MYQVWRYTLLKGIYELKNIGKRSCITVNIISNNEVISDKRSYVSKRTRPVSADIIKMHISLYSLIVRESIPRELDREFYEVSKTYDECCNYIGTDRELASSIPLLKCYQYLESSDNFTLENIVKACTLAWCFEMIAAAFILEDDIMDRSTVRWKKLCWHKKPEIGLTSLIHIKQLRMSAFRIFKKYFKGHPFYTQLLNLLCDISFKTALGQSFDINAASELRKNSKLNFYTMSMYKSIVDYKTGYIMYKIPILAALYLTQIDNSTTHSDCITIMDKLSIYVQAHNDVLDVFGSYENFGRIGNDIENGKCTWLIVTALLHANGTQLKLLKEHYGRDELSSKQIILDVYNELKLLKKFSEYKSNLLEDLKNDINKLSYEPLRTAFQELTKQYVETSEDFVQD